MTVIFCDRPSLCLP